MAVASSPSSRWGAARVTIDNGEEIFECGEIVDDDSSSAAPNTQHPVLAHKRRGVASGVFETHGTAASAAEPFDRLLIRSAQLQEESEALIRSAEPQRAGGGDGERGRVADVRSHYQTLEHRLAILAKDSATNGDLRSLDHRRAAGNQVAGGAGDVPSPCALPSVLADLSDGGQQQVRYECFPPSEPSRAHGGRSHIEFSKVVALERGIAELERRLGTHDPRRPVPELSTTVANLQDRVAKFDRARVETVERRVKVVMDDVDKLLERKAMFERKPRNDARDAEVDRLYEFCQLREAVAGSHGPLSVLTERLRGLDSVAQQGESFGSRLEYLEQQQSQLVNLLESANDDVTALDETLKDDMRELKVDLNRLAIGMAGVVAGT